MVYIYKISKVFGSGTCLGSRKVFAHTRYDVRLKYFESHLIFCMHVLIICLRPQVHAVRIELFLPIITMLNDMVLSTRRPHAHSMTHLRAKCDISAAKFRWKRKFLHAGRHKPIRRL